MNISKSECRDLQARASVWLRVYPPRRIGILCCTLRSAFQTASFCLRFLLALFFCVEDAFLLLSGSAIRCSVAANVYGNQQRSIPQR